MGRYQLLDRLGAGSMGVVYRAYDPNLDRKVAVKLLRIRDLGGTTQGSSRRDEDKQRARFVQEARTMAKVSHPNVAPVFDVGRQGDSMYLAMELMRGDTLEVWMGRNRPWVDVVSLFVQAGRGLAAAHDAGLVHRDFKPSNVMLETMPDGGVRPRVVDFGLAMPVGGSQVPTVSESAEIEASSAELTWSGMAVGTPAYMAPEVHTGSAADPRSDQFSFCVALFEALYGLRPFSGRTAQQLARRKVTGRIVKVDERSVPRWLDRIVRRGLSGSPGDRFGSMRELLYAIENGGPWARRRRATLVAGALLGASLAVILPSAFAWDQPRPTAAESRQRVQRPAANWDVRMSDARRLLEAGRTRLAERELEDLYFVAVEDGAHANASQAARFLADLLAQRGRIAESRRWTRHASSWQAPAG